MAQTFKHAVIACHPEEASFTLSVAQRYAETVRARAQDVVVRDLYRMGFDPVLSATERHGHPADDVEQEFRIPRT